MAEDGPNPQLTMAQRVELMEHHLHLMEQRMHDLHSVLERLVGLVGRMQGDQLDILGFLKAKAQETVQDQESRGNGEKPGESNEK